MPVTPAQERRTVTVLFARAAGEGQALAESCGIVAWKRRFHAAAGRVG